jgi:hypothetical protein
MQTQEFPNPIVFLAEKLDRLTQEVSALRKALQTKEQPSEDIGGLDLAVGITGLARRSIYKACCKRTIPHLKVGGRLYFKRSELVAWIDQGRRPMVSETVEERMRGTR